MKRHASLVGLWLAAAASAAGAPPGVGPLVPVSGVSPFLNCTADEAQRQPGQVSVGSEVEPRLAVNPKDPRNLVGVFQQDRWNNGGARGIVAGVSFDGGVSWRSVVVPRLSNCSGGAYTRASDPWVSFAPNGDVYVAALGLAVDDREPREFHDLQTPPSSSIPAADNGVLVSKSTDGGLNWSDPVLVIGDGAGPLNDKEAVTADPTDPSGRLVYVVWDRLESLADAVTRGPVMFSRTTDGGITWEPARPVYDPGPRSSTVGNQIVVLPDGTLLDFFSEFVATPAPGGGFYYVAYLSLVASMDKGRTWGAVRRAFVIGAPAVEDPDAARSVRQGGGLVDVAADPRSGVLYAVLTSRDGDGSTAIALAGSTDAGVTWASITRGGRPFINRTPVAGLNGQAFTPTIRVSARGTVGVTYYDFRNNGAGPASLTDYWLVRCDPVQQADCRVVENWTRETRLTDTSFDLGQAPYAYGLFLGDYEGLATDGDGFLAFFSQSHGNDPASIFFRRIGP